MNELRKIFFRGLFTFLPMALTIYIAYAGVSIVDNLLGAALRAVLPIYIPGLGFLLTILIIFLLGLLLNNLIAAGFLASIERRLTQVPFIKAIYSPLKDLMNLFSKGGGPEGLKSVVLVNLPSGGKALGVVTREDFEDLHAINNQIEDSVAVYIPLSYALGGITLIMPRNQLTPVDIPIEKAMKVAITGWVKVEPHGIPKK
ncbi:MAG TPA: DUF502 domain-containing protein [Pseudobdellovibrionaceae bacterium]|jgi:uncharacterized membrane protein|nr:DUF502 domain-containing protein [Pseudobdellovibrionaceae bacterium]